MWQSAKHIFRLLTIIFTLARFGALEPVFVLVRGSSRLAFLVWIGRIFQLVMFRGNKGQRPGEHLRQAFTHLGPAFVKFGQTLSTRSDLIGEAMATDLAMLRDRLQPFSYKIVRQSIKQELGQELEEFFDDFDPVPVSAASIAQVHFAKLKKPLNSGVIDVAVKVLRPGIEKSFLRDMALFLWLAHLLNRLVPKLRRLKLLDITETFIEVAEREMDLRLEAAAAAELADYFKNDPTYKVPAIDWRYTSQRILTQERIHGWNIDDKEALIKAGIDINVILKNAAEAFFKQVFRDGYFHGDQHPGNMFVTRDGKIAVVDFGIMGRLDKKSQYYLVDMLRAFLERNYLKVAKVHLRAGYIPAGTSLENFAQSCRAIGEPIVGLSLDEISLAKLLSQLFRLAKTYRMEIQPQLLLLQKNMLMAEGIGRHLNPDLNIWILIKPMIAGWMQENRGIEARIANSLHQGIKVLERIPELTGKFEKTLDTVANHEHITQQLLLTRYRRFRYVNDSLLWLSIIALASWFFLH
ncbi:MAG: 2-polyprenylphenol 6-hydroxylase [Alphaproteobacteria bacterium]|nr:2-polyprenylphenol 6-hydroxylase [Alphaproteobacteria bacterium]